MHVGVVHYLACMKVSTIVIANVDILRLSIYDSSCDVTKCTSIVAIDRERRIIMDMYISVELEKPFRFTGALGPGDVFGFESLHTDEILLPWQP
jgi:hypothetical protein